MANESMIRLTDNVPLALGAVALLALAAVRSRGTDGSKAKIPEGWSLHTPLPIPDVGSVVEWEGRSWRVSAWICEAVPTHDPDDWLASMIYESARPMEDGKRLRFCYRHQAQYLSLKGVSGAIAAVADVVPIGEVPWPKELLDRDRETANMLAGKLIP